MIDFECNLLDRLLKSYKMEEEKKDDKQAAAAPEASPGSCSKVMSQLDNLVRSHGVYVVAMAALAVIGLHLYNRYGKPSN